MITYGIIFSSKVSALSRIIKTNITLNTRDLGGLKTTKGYKTLKNVFIRSDNLAYNDDSIYSLYDLVKKQHLKTVIDLRVPNEIKGMISASSIYKGIDYHHLSLVNYMPLGYGIPTGHNYHFLSDWYIEIIENSKNEIKNIIQTIAKAKKGAILFNCTMGKDRTSILSCILLLIAKVDKKTIAKDHALSNKNVASAYAPYLHSLKDDQLIFTNVTYQDMIRLVDYINEKYSDIDNFLIQCGVDKKDIKKIYNRFVDKRSKK